MKAGGIQSVASDRVPVHSKVREHVCACAVGDAWECARTYRNVGYVESLRYVLTCLSRQPCAVCQPIANSGWSFTEVHQSPRVVIASEGDSINITCSTRGDLDGILMKRIWPQDYEVIYFEDGEEPTVDKTFSDRIDFSGSQKNLTITMRLLQLSDTGAYTCEAVRKVSARGLFTTVVVRGKGCTLLTADQAGSLLPARGFLCTCWRCLLRAYFFLEIS